MAGSGKRNIPALGGFSLYLEGPRDRDIVRSWARRVSPQLAKVVDRHTVLLGGRQPARAVDRHRRLREGGEVVRALCVLDRDGLPEPAEAMQGEPGIEFYTWPRRHIESYLLVSTAILRCVPKSRSRGDVRRWVKDCIPEAADEEALRAIDAKRLFSERGPFGADRRSRLLPGRVARQMRHAELHGDVLEVLALLGEGAGIRTASPEVIVR